MRTLKQKQKGKGWFGNRLKDLRRLLTGRKRTMRNAKQMSSSEMANLERKEKQARKTAAQFGPYTAKGQEYTKKAKKLKNEIKQEKEFRQLAKRTKVANTNTEERETAEALKARTKTQKLFNKLLFRKGELKSIPNQSKLSTSGQITNNRGRLLAGTMNKYMKQLNINHIGIANLPFKKENDKVVFKNKRNIFNISEAKIPDENLPEPGPAPYRPTNEPVDGNDMKETQVQAQVRVLPFFYALWRQFFTPQDVLTNDYATVVESLADNNQPIHISQMDEQNIKEFLDAVKASFDEAQREFPQNNEDENTGRQQNTRVRREHSDVVAEEIFNSTANVMNKVLKRLEYAGPTDQERYIVNTLDRTVDGQFVPVQKIAVGGAISFDRYIAFLTAGLDYINSTYEHDSQRCMMPIAFRIQAPHEMKNTNEEPGKIYRPLVTLKSNECLTIFNGLENFVKFTNMSPDNEMFLGSWIVLDKSYFPLRATEGGGGGGGPFDYILAKSIPHATYIQRSLQDWTIEAIDPALFTLFEIKYPMYSMKISTYMSTPERFLRLQESIRRERQDYPVGAGQFEFVNFMLIDEEILKENTTFLAHVNPFEGKTKISELAKKAIDSQKLYGISPYLAYMMKLKYITQYYTAFKTARISRAEDPIQKILQTYNTLNAQQKISFDFLQYLYFINKFQTVVLQPLNRGRSSKQQFTERFQQVRDIYKEPITQAVMGLILSFYTAENSEALANLQTMVDDQTPPNTTVEFLRTILRKFVSSSSRLTNNVEPVFQSRRLNLVRQQLNTRKRERNQVAQQIAALEQEKNTLSKQWNPFTAKTRKQRLQQLNSNLGALRQNLAIKQRFVNQTLEQSQNAEEQLLRVRNTELRPAERRRARPASVYSNARESQVANNVVGLAPAVDPFNNEF